MAIGLSTAAQNAGIDAIVDLVDGGAGAGTLKIYTGSKPATPNTAESGTLLATVTFADPAFGAGSSGVAAATDPASVTAGANGTAGWFRIEDSTGANVCDGTVGTSGADLNLAAVALTSGMTVDITSFSLTLPAI